MTEKTHDEVEATSDQEKQDAPARMSGSVGNDITPGSHPVNDAIEDLNPGASDSDGHR